MLSRVLDDGFAVPIEALALADVTDLGPHAQRLEERAVDVPCEDAHARRLQAQQHAHERDGARDVDRSELPHVDVRDDGARGRRQDRVFVAGGSGQRSASASAADGSAHTTSERVRS